MASWAIWTSRNKHIMENKPQPAQEVSTRIRSFLRELDELGKKLPGQARPVTVRWSSPTDPYVKINFGAAIKVQSRQSRTGFLIINTDGRVLGSGMMINLHIPDAFSIEGLACVQSLQLALNMGFTMVEVEGDSRTVISKIMQENEDNARFLGKPIFRHATRDCDSGFEWT